MKGLLTNTLLAVLAGLTGAGLAAAAGEDSPYCRTPPEALDLVDFFRPGGHGDCDPDQACWRERLEAVRRLSEQYPDNPMVHRAYQDGVRSLGRLDPDLLAAVRAAYAARAEARPDDPVSVYLDARLLESVADMGEAYSRSVELDPAFPWGHLGIAVLGRDDAESRERHMERFLELCPGRFQEPLYGQRAIDSADFWKRHLPRLQQAVDAAPENQRFYFYPSLWSAEFKSVPLEEHAAVREHIREDLAKFEALGRESDASWWDLLEQGYSLIGDEEGRTRVRARTSAAFPCSRTAIEVRNKRWQDLQDEVRSLEPEAAIEKRREIFALADEWLAQCSDDYSMASLWFASLRGTDPPAEALLAGVDRFLEVWEKNRRRVRTFKSPYAIAGETLLDRRVGVERVPDLLEREIESLTKIEAEEDEHLSPVEIDEHHRDFGRRIAELRRQIAEARRLLGDPDVEVDAATAKVAEAADTVEVAQQASPWDAPSRPLPDFELSDLAGHTWHAEDFRGKTVLINFWATWCSPCRDELPYVEKLARRLSGRDDATVVTINIDDNLGVVAPFLAREKLTVTVLLGLSWFGEVSPEDMGVPQNWIVDRDGVVRFTEVGFSPELGERWIDDVLDKFRSAGWPG